MRILWENDHGYVDFQVEGISGGVFRVANSDDYDILDTLKKVEKNHSFFNHVLNVGVGEVFKEASVNQVFSNGWEWKEIEHEYLAQGFSIGSACSWFSCPFGHKLPDIREMNEIHAIKADGLRLLWKYNPNLAPARVAYFFPYA